MSSTSLTSSLGLISPSNEPHPRPRSTVDVGIPRNQVHFSIYRTEVGSPAVGEALIGERLFELCRDHGFWLRPVLRVASQATGTLALPLSPLPPTCPQAPSHPRMSLLFRTQEFDTATGPQGRNSILLPPRIPLSLAFQSSRALCRRVRYCW